MQEEVYFELCDLYVTFVLCKFTFPKLDWEFAQMTIIEYTPVVGDALLSQKMQ